MIYDIDQLSDLRGLRTTTVEPEQAAEFVFGARLAELEMPPSPLRPWPARINEPRLSAYGSPMLPYASVRINKRHSAAYALLAQEWLCTKEGRAYASLYDEKAAFRAARDKESAARFDKRGPQTYHDNRPVGDFDDSHDW